MMGAAHLAWRGQLYLPGGERDASRCGTVMTRRAAADSRRQPHVGRLGCNTASARPTPSEIAGHEVTEIASEGEAELRASCHDSRSG